MKQSELMDTMYSIYGYPTVDWMGFEVADNNTITYHHIIEVQNGGKKTVENGALLTKRAHKKLHQIQFSDPKLYKEFQYWFRVINDMKRPPTPEIMEIMMKLKGRLQTAIDVNRLIKQEMNKYYQKAKRANFPKRPFIPQKCLKKV